MQNRDFYELLPLILSELSVPKPFHNPNVVIKPVLVRMPEIERVIYSNPVTVILWKDHTKTTVRCQKGDTYSPLTGFALCVMKRIYGKKEFYRLLHTYEPVEETTKE